jgi:trehalose synthase
VLAAYAELPRDYRSRVHIVTLPMEDAEENAAMVNALQRHAAVVVQKSLGEGFGLTVTEAMAKGRPLVASAVGGILEQIEDGVHGRLVQDPRDPVEFANTLAGLLEDPVGAEAMGTRARERALHRFTGLGAMSRYADLLARVDDSRRGK